MGKNVDDKKEKGVDEDRIQDRVVVEVKDEQVDGSLGGQVEERGGFQSSSPLKS
jgi:hypothetical protein